MPVCSLACGLSPPTSLGIGERGRWGARWSPHSRLKSLRARPGRGLAVRGESSDCGFARDHPAASRSSGRAPRRANARFASLRDFHHGLLAVAPRGFRSQSCFKPLSAVLQGPKRCSCWHDFLARFTFLADSVAHLSHALTITPSDFHRTPHAWIWNKRAPRHSRLVPRFAKHFGGNCVLSSPQS